MAPPLRNDRPQLWIIAGPNGSGKSTLYSQDLFEETGRAVWIINPDLLSARIADVEGLPYVEANLAAVKRIETWLAASIATHQTIGVETVLSTPKYRKHVRAAKQLGIEIALLYVILESAELQLTRIAARVVKGGHDVPPDKVRDRRRRSLRQLRWFFAEADIAQVFDNSGAELKLIAEKRGGATDIYADAMPEVRRALIGADSQLRLRSRD